VALLLRGVTHAAIGAAGVLLYEVLMMGEPEPEAAAMAMTVAVAGALLPDIDHPGSLVSRKATLVLKGTRLGVWITAVVLLVMGLYVYWPLMGVGLFMFAVSLVPHRGVTHSLVGALAIGLLLWAFAGSHVVPFMIGYLLHLLADMFTGGVPLFWPRENRIAIMHAKTGGLVDYLCLFVSLGFVSYWAANRVI